MSSGNSGYTICIVPIKLDIPDITPTFIGTVTKYLFTNYLPNATPTTFLINNSAKTDQEAPLNTALRSIKDLEWNYAVVIKTKKKDEAFVVYFMRNIYNQLQSKPFRLDNAIATLKEVLTEKDTFSIAPLTKVNLTPTNAVYYLPKKKRLSSLPENCLQEIVTHLTLNDYHTLTQTCKSINRKTADIITTNLLKGELKKDLIHQIFSHDNLKLLKKFSHIFKDINLAYLLNKYWNALDCWSYLFKKEIINKSLIYQHYPLGKAIFACIVGYGYNTQTEIYIEGYNLYYEPEIPLQSSINPTEFHFFELENKLRQFIQTADLKINQFPYEYNMIDHFTKTVYCKGLPNKEFTVGLSFYDIVTKARYYFVNRVQTYLSNKMLKYLFGRGLSYLPNPKCNSTKQLRYPHGRVIYRTYNPATLEGLLNYYYTSEEKPQLQIRVDPITHEITPNSGSYNIFSNISEEFRILPEENSIVQDIMIYVNEANKKIEEI